MMKFWLTSDIILLPGTMTRVGWSGGRRMLLALDIGNTLTDLGLYEGNQLVSTFKIKTVSNKSLDEYKISFSSFLASKGNPIVNQAIISSVVPSLTLIFSALCEELIGHKPLILGKGIHSGLPLKVDNPLEVGSDLIADAVGGNKKYGNSLFIADLGTASKYLYIDSKGAFAGLAIAPGLAISLDALVNGTAALPEIPLLVPKKVMGKNTVDCMRSGLLNGEAYRAMGFYNSFSKEAGTPLTPILTGGNAEFIKELLPEFHYDEWLLLDGLFEIEKRNQ